MTIALTIAGLLIWLNVGILAYRNTSDLGSEPLESLKLPLRLITIFLSPIGFLIFERHLFYSKSYSGSLDDIEQ